MGDALGALGGAIPRDKTLRGLLPLLPKRTICGEDKALRDCCVSFPKRTILSSASVGIRARDVTLGLTHHSHSSHINLY